ncbi:heavy-metal-associated domain-containing protein [Methanoregula sp.]|uniref:heavy-metal-associated domain-containing protein n=1 Tax=Methanoregula sp. TaxID=2052170 RepID=UPI0035640379
MTEQERNKPEPGSAGTAAMKEIVINVGGMMCGHCIKRTEAALGRLPGVTRATVSLEKKQVAVVFDPSRSSPDDMKKAIVGAGYQYLGYTGEA